MCKLIIMCAHFSYFQDRFSHGKNANLMNSFYRKGDVYIRYRVQALEARLYLYYIVIIDVQVVFMLAHSQRQQQQCSRRRHQRVIYSSARASSCDLKPQVLLIDVCYY